MKRFFKIIRLSAAFFLIFAAFSCSRFGRTRAVSTEFATFIKSYTGGIISDKSTVKVQLTSKVDGALPGAELKDGVITFSPSLKGTARWASPDVVEFIPDADAMKAGQAYVARFRLDKVMKVRHRFSRFTFRFLVSEKVATIRTGDLTVTASAPDKASVDGLIHFTESLPVETVRKMFTVDYPSDSVETNIIPGDDPSTFRDEVYNLSRAKKDRKLVLSLSTAGTPFKSASSQTVVIPAAGGFSVADAVLDFLLGENDGMHILVRVLVLRMGGFGEFREVEVDALLTVARRADDGREELDARHLVARLFGCLALRALDRIFARFEPARDDFDKCLFRRLAVLPHEHEPAVGTSGEDCDGVAVSDYLAFRPASVGQFDVKQIDAYNLPRVLALCRERLFRQVCHFKPFSSFS